MEAQPKKGDRVEIHASDGLTYRGVVSRVYNDRTFDVRLGSGIILSGLQIDDPQITITSTVK